MWCFTTLWGNKTKPLLITVWQNSDCTNSSYSIKLFSHMTTLTDRTLIGRRWNIIKWSRINSSATTPPEVVNHMELEHFVRCNSHWTCNPFQQMLVVWFPQHSAGNLNWSHCHLQTQTWRLHQKIFHLHLRLAVLQTTWFLLLLQLNWEENLVPFATI